MYTKPFYTKKDGKYYYHFGSVRARIGEEVAIGFTMNKEGHGTFHKHGLPSDVREWYEKVMNNFCTIGANDLASEVKMITSKEIDPEEINKMINVSGYIESWVKESGLKP